MTPGTRMRRAHAVAVLLLVTLAAAGCAEADRTAADGIGEVLTARLRMSGDPAQQRFRDVGPDGSIRYGLGTLSGRTELAGRPVTMEAEYALDYTDGSGPFRGYWTITWPDGDVLAFRYRGSTTATGDRSSITGDLEVLGGTGAYGAVTGDGSVRAVRDGPVGSPVDYVVTLRVAGLP